MNKYYVTAKYANDDFVSLYDTCEGISEKRIDIWRQAIAEKLDIPLHHVLVTNIIKLDE
jgi:hypothetical protein